MTSCKYRISGTPVWGEGGVAGEGKLIVYQTFIPGVSDSTTPLANIQSDWMSNASSSLCINFYYLYR